MRDIRRECTPLAKSRPRAFPCLLGLDLAVARRGIGLQRGQQAPCAVGDFGNRAVERLGIGLRGRIEAGELAHELQRGRMDLRVGGRGSKLNRVLILRHMVLSSAPIVGQGRTAGAKSDNVAYSVMDYAARSPLSAPANSEFQMTHVTYKIVEHDGGWAYTVNGVFSEPFPNRAAALAAARRVAAEQRVPGRTEMIEYETPDGRWHSETAAGNDRPETEVES